MGSSEPVYFKEALMPEPLPDHIMCAKCAQIKPRRDFKRRLTPKEMRRYGKSGESGTLMTVLSKFCKECRPRKKRWESLGLAELERIKKDGAEFNRISEYRLEKLIARAKEKDVAANASRSLVLKRKHGEKVLTETLKEMDATIKKLRARASNKANGEHKRAYLRQLLAYATRTRDHMKMDISMGDYKKWVQMNPKQFTNYLTTEELSELRTLHDDIPEPERSLMRTIY
jgi:ribosomal protein L15